MKLLKHKTSKDTAIELVFQEGDRWNVNFWNIAGLRIGEKPFECGYGVIRIRPMDEYEEIEV